MGNFSEDLAILRMNGFVLKGKQIQFPVYHLDGVSIDDLSLSVRASNGLKRAGIMTAEQIIEKDLSKMRNLGVKSVKEIKNAVLNYSYENMTDKQKKAFWESVIA